MLYFDHFYLEWPLPGFRYVTIYHEPIFASEKCAGNRQLTGHRAASLVLIIAGVRLLPFGEDFGGDFAAANQFL